jgi:hypothetical protein
MLTGHHFGWATWSLGNLCVAWWSGIDIRYLPNLGLAMRMSNPKLHQKFIFASGHSILTFAGEPAEKDANV